MTRSLVQPVLQLSRRQARAIIKVGHIGPSIMPLVPCLDSHQKTPSSREEGNEPWPIDRRDAQLEPDRVRTDHDVIDAGPERDADMVVIATAITSKVDAVARSRR